MLVIRGAGRDKGRQGVRCVLEECGSVKKGKGRRERGPIQWLVREEIKIDGRPVPESQGNRRSAVEHKPHPWRRTECRPQLSLGRGQDLQAGREGADHATARLGIAGT